LHDFGIFTINKVDVLASVATWYINANSN